MVTQPVGNDMGGTLNPNGRFEASDGPNLDVDEEDLWQLGDEENTWTPEEVAEFMESVGESCDGGAYTFSLFGHEILVRID